MQVETPTSPRTLRRSGEQSTLHSAVSDKQSRHPYRRSGDSEPPWRRRGKRSRSPVTTNSAETTPTKSGARSPAWHRRDLPEFDRLRREREREIRRRQQLRLHSEGSSSAGASSSSAAPGAPPPEGYNSEHFGVTLGPEDFVSDEQMEHMMAAALLRSQYEAEEKAATAKLNAVVNEGLLQQALVISTLPPTIDLVTDSDEE